MDIFVTHGRFASCPSVPWHVPLLRDREGCRRNRIGTDRICSRVDTVRSKPCGSGGGRGGCVYIDGRAITNALERRTAYKSSLVIQFTERVSDSYKKSVIYERSSTCRRREPSGCPIASKLRRDDCPFNEVADDSPSRLPTQLPTETFRVEAVVPCATSPIPNT